jgi:hypothetical protein
MPSPRVRWSKVARAWLTFVAHPAPEVAAPSAVGGRVAVLATLLAVAMPLALAAAVVVSPLADHLGIESRLDFRFGPLEVATVLAFAPVIEELVFRWPLKSRRTFERGVFLLPLAGLALFAIARAAMELPSPWLRLPAIAVAVGAAALLLLWLDDAIERRRFTRKDAAGTVFARRYPLLAHAFTFAFALTHALNYEFSVAALAFLPLLVAPQWILGYACLYARLVYGLPAAIALHVAHNLIAYSLVAIGL